MSNGYPQFDVLEICQDAYERAGMDFRSAYSLRTARRSLELMQIEWANRGLNLWTIVGPETVTLTPGQNRYNLPEDTVDLIEHSIRTWNSPGDSLPESLTLSQGWGGQAFFDMPLTRITVSDYAAIPNKQAWGRPTLIHIRRQIKPFFVLWMTPPPVPRYQVLLWRLCRMDSRGAGGTAMPEIPWRFIPAMVSGLAYYVSMKSKDAKVMQKIPLLKASYEEQFQLASDEDRDRSSFHWVPWTQRW